MVDAVPGYGGYRPRFSTEPLGTSYPAFRYTFVPEEGRSPVEDNRNRSVYSQTLTATVGPGSDFRARPRQLRDTGAGETRTASHWTSEYKARLDAQDTYRKSRILEAKARSVDEKARSVALERSRQPTGPEHTLRRPDLRSTQHTDFALPSNAPMSRSLGLAGARSLSLNASTSDLNAGSAKAGGRVPGYTGHVPATARNATCVRGDTGSSGLIDNPAQNFKQHIPGTTVYQPKSAANSAQANSRVTERAAPRKRVFAASLITESMKGNIYS